MKTKIPVVDLFAGPGGLSEGFASCHRLRSCSLGDSPFRVVLSIESDLHAHWTLKLRSLFRLFGENVPDEYYDGLRAGLGGADLFDSLSRDHPKFAAAAAREAKRRTLGSTDPGHDAIREMIEDRLRKSKRWVLLGGPPCQAYSVAGRSRNRGIAGYDPEKDERHYLYKEYLRVIADHWPSVFVMENVKGLLSASVREQRLFGQIIADLRDPARAVPAQERSDRQHNYRLYSLTGDAQSELREQSLSSSVVHMEDYGVPQTRHRVILLGVRDDVGIDHPATLVRQDEVRADWVLSDLPRVRSGLSKGGDSTDAWMAVLDSIRRKKWLANGANGRELADLIERQLDNVKLPRRNRGGEFVPSEGSVRYRPEWYHDPRIGGAINHSTRGHIPEDLHRYFYAACFAKARHRSPVLADFPPSLLPAHDNVEKALGGGYFADRFRVQLKEKPAKTVTSHISKDGHYYIHYDPTQCRSLTVREAARLQTFPDNYVFTGPRTAQYVQVGNAVPPLLAAQIAVIVSDVLDRAGGS